MNPRAALWNILHDGSINQIRGSVPGELTIQVDIQYLCEELAAERDEIVIHLANCRRFAMNVWAEKQWTEHLQEIAALDPEILGTDSDDVPVQLITTLGELIMDFDSFSITINNGVTLTFEQLSQACENYWRRFANQAKESPRQ